MRKQVITSANDAQFSDADQYLQTEIPATHPEGAVGVSFIHTMTARSVLPGSTVPRQFLQLQRQMKAVKVQKQKLQRRQVQKTEIPTTVLLLMQRRTKNL